MKENPNDPPDARAPEGDTCRAECTQDGMSELLTEIDHLNSRIAAMERVVEVARKWKGIESIDMHEVRSKNSTIWRWNMKRPEKDNAVMDSRASTD